MHLGDVISMRSWIQSVVFTLINPDLNEGCAVWFPHGVCFVMRFIIMDNPLNHHRMLGDSYMLLLPGDKFIFK